jgi:putative lysine/arginine/ornithine/histidine/octopine transport system permease protein
MSPAWLAEPPPWLQESWEAIDAAWQPMLDGLCVTGGLLAGSALMGTALALLLALAAAMGPRPVAAAARLYSAVLRGTPLLVQLFMAYFGLSQFEWVRQSPAWWLLEDATYCGLLVLTLNLAAYMAQDLRAGMLAVPQGERQAALALGFTPWQCMRCIVLPRALRIALPALGNQVIAQLKATALVSTITVLDLTGAARQLSVASYTTDALLVAGGLYAALTLAIVAGVRWLEKRHARKTQGH